MTRRFDISNHIMSGLLPAISSRDKSRSKLYDGRQITRNQQPGHGKIKVICVSDISDAVSLRNYWVRFFYYGQFHGHHIICLSEKYIMRPYFLTMGNSKKTIENRCYCALVKFGVDIAKSQWSP